MLYFAIVALLVAIVDQTVKQCVRSRLAARRMSLGTLGDLRIVQARIWMMAGRRPVSVRLMWAIWVTAVTASAWMSGIVPNAGWAFGLLAGGAFSHAIEMTMRGNVCDYVCLRFWPAFNLADVALAVGLLGVVFSAVMAI